MVESRTGLFSILPKVVIDKAHRSNYSLVQSKNATSSVSAGLHFTAVAVVQFALEARRLPIANHSQIHAVEDAQYKVLELLRKHPELSQRQMAEKLGLTLGKTHYSIKALVAAGWVKTQRFVNSDHKAGYIYVLTPSGISQRLALANSLLERKRREFERLGTEIALLEDRISDKPKYKIE